MGQMGILSRSGSRISRKEKNPFQIFYQNFYLKTLCSFFLLYQQIVLLVLQNELEMKGRAMDLKRGLKEYLFVCVEIYLNHHFYTYLYPYLFMYLYL